MGPPLELISLLESEADLFTTYLSTLSEKDWLRPSACEGWNVSHVVAHVTGQDFSLRIRRGLSGDISPPPGSPAVEDHDEDKFAEVIFERAFSTAEALGYSLLTELSSRLYDSIEVFKSVSGDQWGTLCYWPPGPETIRTMLDMRISEFRPDPEIDSVLRYRFDLIDLPDKVQDVIVNADGCYLEANSNESVRTSFSCKAESYVLIMYGRLKMKDALASGLLVCEDGTEFAMEFGNRFIGG